MRPHVAELARLADTYVACHPNAGLPNAFGDYDQTPEEIAELLAGFAADGMVNIVGGCCGTTPPHIAAIASAVRGAPKRTIPHPAGRTRNMSCGTLAYRSKRRAPGSVKLRAGGESPRPVRIQRPVDPVKFRDRR